MDVIIFTDGGARGNPGPAASGYVIKNELGENIAEVGLYLGHTTNNQAEYQALLNALLHAQNLGASVAHCFLDSELIVKQIKGEYKVKNKDLAPHFLKIWNLLHSFKTYTIAHIPRERNKEADALVNRAIDAHTNIGLTE